MKVKSSHWIEHPDDIYVYLVTVLMISDAHNELVACLLFTNSNLITDIINKNDNDSNNENNNNNNDNNNANENENGNDTKSTKNENKKGNTNRHS